jgi:hypothetical protein
MRRLLPLLVLAALLAMPGSASALKGCPTRDSFTAGPYFADQVRARGVSCRTARRQVKRWGNAQRCYNRPSNNSCVVRGWHCSTRTIGYETSRARCTRGKRRAVGFRFGS